MTWGKNHGCLAEHLRTDCQLDKSSRSVFVGFAMHDILTVKSPPSSPEQPEGNLREISIGIELEQHELRRKETSTRQEAKQMLETGCLPKRSAHNDSH